HALHIFTTSIPLYSHLHPLPPQQHISPIGPYVSALANSAQPSHSTRFSFLLFSYTYALFCTGKNLNPFLFRGFRTLYQKHPGWGWGDLSHSPLLVLSSPPYFLTSLLPPS